jgi:glycosyltransferase involved in cell wall biosynthesis
VRLLFVESDYPPQWRSLLATLAGEGRHTIVYLHDPFRNPGPDIAGIVVEAYETPRRLKPEHPEAGDFVNAVARAAAVRTAAERLARQGFSPEIIWAHHAYGEILMLPEIFPRAKLLIFFEYFFDKPGAEVGFDPEFPATPAQKRLGRFRNAASLVTLQMAHAGVCPTRWQRDRFPRRYQDLLTVIHDGVDTTRIRPDPQARFTLPDGRVLTRQQEPIVTFSVRGLEPLRGFHVFMRALPHLFRQRPEARIVIAGRDKALYGPGAGPGQSWVGRMRDELGRSVPWDRIHFVGSLPEERLLALHQVSSAHIYLTYPFVLSWSCLEAMAAGAPVIGSATPPVEEVIRHEETGLLVDFFDPEAVANAIRLLLENPEKGQQLGDKARAFVRANFDAARVCIPRQRALLESLRSRTSQ